jgi:monothiol glutaredoxin
VSPATIIVRESSFSGAKSNSNSTASGSALFVYGYGDTYMTSNKLSVFKSEIGSPPSDEGERDLLAEIDKEVKSHPVVLYMKGNLHQPMCGFSQRAAGILMSYSVEIYAVNVLEDEKKRQGVKEYSDWPTIPQVYINGSFIGGSDILLELHESGKLAELLKDR